MGFSSQQPHGLGPMLLIAVPGESDYFLWSPRVHAHTQTCKINGFLKAFNVHHPFSHSFLYLALSSLTHLILLVPLFLSLYVLHCLTWKILSLQKFLLWELHTELSVCLSLVSNIERNEFSFIIRANILASVLQHCVCIVNMLREGHVCACRCWCFLLYIVTEFFIEPRACQFS